MSPSRNQYLRENWTYMIIIPAKPRAVKSQSNKWLSVPPVTNLHFLLNKADAKAFAFFLTCCMYALYSGLATCFRAMARAAMWLLWGPPCNAGKTAKFIFSSSNWLFPSPWTEPCFLDLVPFLQKMIPPLGPRRLLCVVEVTMSQ